MTIGVPRILFKNDIGGFKAKTELPLRPGLTVLVGPNGSGKSTLLSTLSGVGDYRSTYAQLLDISMPVVYHDFHLDDLRTKAWLDPNNYEAQCSSYGRSSGEGVVQHIVAMLSNVVVPTLFIFDEFDRGIHLTTQRLLTEAITTTLKKTGSMCLASAHGAGVIMTVDEVLDIVSGDYIIGREYVIKSLLG